MNPAFFTLHSDLPREGPGDRAGLHWALLLAGTGKDSRILDAGCGPGADIAGLLAHAPAGQVTALDMHEPFIRQVLARHAGDGRVLARVGDMAAPCGPYDLIWCAGALYFLGVTGGLNAWRKALAAGGAVAFSELVWLTDTRETALERTLCAEYPAIGTIATLRARIAEADYRVRGMRVLPDAAWENYFKPVEARVAMLRARADAGLSAVLDEAEAEIALWRHHRDRFGYVLSVVCPR